MAGVGRVAAAVIEEITDVVRLEYLDQALVLGLVFRKTLQFIAAGTERAGGRMSERRDVRRAFLTGVDQILAQRADNAIASGIDVCNRARMFAGGLNNARGAGIDHGRHPAGLGIKCIAGGHGYFTPG